MDCVFCKIVNGEIPSYKVWEDENNLAFLSLHPMKEGHTLVIPKKHVDYIFDIDDSDYLSLMAAVKKVGILLKDVFKPKTGKMGVMVYGLDVSHTHVHVSPIDKGGDLSFSIAHPASEAELRATLDKIQALV